MIKIVAKKLSDIAEITMGQSPRSEYYNSNEEGMPFLQGNRTFGDKYPNFDTYTTNPTKIANVNDVIMSVRAPVGDLNITPKKICLGRGVCSIHMKNGNQDFLYYLMKYYVKDILNRECGTVFGSVNKNDISSLIVKIPERFEEQKKISSILSVLDDKIELNKKINRNLEAQAQAIFKSWFIDFEPFKNGKFIDSELGRIPEGWKVESIYSISEVIYGAPFSSNLFNNKQLGTPIIRIRDLPNEASNTYTTESHPKGYLIKQGDIVVGMDGEFKAYLWGGDNAWLNQRICVFKSKLNVSTAFVMFSIVPLLNEVESSELATTVIHLGKNDIDRFKIILPKLNILKEFNRISIPIFDAIIKNKRESQRLAQLRDTLLPKLMSGEVNISDFIG